jgi:hypothetical protein
MLIVLSGSETIRKATLAWTITQQLNSIKHTDNNYQQLLDNNTNNQLKMQFRAIWTDFGVKTDSVFPEGGNYKAFLSQYHARPYPILVISGSFSKTFVNMLTRDIDKVYAINITRNPSVVYTIDSITQDTAPYNTTTGVKLLKQRNESSFVQSVILKQMPNVQTIKFESILETGTIQIGNHAIDLSCYRSYNNVLTQDEYHNLMPKCSLSPLDVDQFNYLADNFKKVLPSNRSDIPQEIAEQLPSSLFRELDYQPLSLQEITCPTL